MRTVDRDAIKEGIKAGIRAYAVHNVGQQLVGVMRIPLKRALQEVDDESPYWLSEIEAIKAELMAKRDLIDDETFPGGLQGARR